MRGTYLTAINFCRIIFPSLSLSICSSHWEPWEGPTGMKSLPPGLSCFMRASGTGYAAAPTCIASYGASVMLKHLYNYVRPLPKKNFKEPRRPKAENLGAQQVKC